MKKSEALDKLLKAYRGYYNVNRESPALPFEAEALFSLHDEQYFLVRAARISEADSREILFFITEENLTDQRLLELEARAWEEGLSRVVSGPNHRNTDIGLCILADHVEPEAAKRIRGLRRFKAYKMGLHGYTHFRLVAYDLGAGTLVRNRMGEPFEKVICNTL